MEKISLKNTIDEIKAYIKAQRKQLLYLRLSLQRATEKFNTAQIKSVRRSIARGLTFLKEKQRG